MFFRLAAVFPSFLGLQLNKSIDLGQVRHMVTLETSHSDTAVIAERAKGEKFGDPQAYFVPPTGT